MGNRKAPGVSGCRKSGWEKWGGLVWEIERSELPAQSTRGFSPELGAAHITVAAAGGWREASFLSSCSSLAREKAWWRFSGEGEALRRLPSAICSPSLVNMSGASFGQRAIAPTTYSPSVVGRSTRHRARHSSLGWTHTRCARERRVDGRVWVGGCLVGGGKRAIPFLATQTGTTTTMGLPRQSTSMAPRHRSSLRFTQSRKRCLLRADERNDRS